jgi:hypothetical protein
VLRNDRKTSGNRTFDEIITEIDCAVIPTHAAVRRTTLRPWHRVFARSSSRSATASITAFDSQLPDHSRAQRHLINTSSQRSNPSNRLGCTGADSWAEEELQPDAILSAVRGNGGQNVQLKSLGKLQKRECSSCECPTRSNLDFLGSIVASAPANPGHLLERVLIVLLAAAAGFTLCSAILQKSDPLMGTQDAHFFSIVVAVLFAGVAWKLS